MQQHGLKKLEGIARTRRLELLRMFRGWKKEYALGAGCGMQIVPLLYISRKEADDETDTD